MSHTDNCNFDFFTGHASVSRLHTPGEEVGTWQSSHVCSFCGSSVPRDSPRSLCSRCLPCLPKQSRRAQPPRKAVSPSQEPAAVWEALVCRFYLQRSSQLTSCNWTFSENIYWVGQKVCSGFSYTVMENSNKLFGQPNMFLKTGLLTVHPGLTRTQECHTPEFTQTWMELGK